CAAKAANDLKQRAGCTELTPKERYRGTLYALEQTFLFAPAGQPSCTGQGAQPYCAAADGNMWIRGEYDAHCPRLYRVEIIGRRNVLPGASPAYRIKVD